MDLDEVLSGTTDRRLRNTFLALSLCNIADAVEITAVGFLLSRLSTSQESQISQHQKELLGAAVITGLLVGGLVVGVAADRVGRKPSLQLSLLVTATSGLLSAFSPNISTLIALRLMGGLGVGGVLPVMYTLGAELFPSAHRDSLLCAVGVSWVIGSLYASTAAWLLFETNLIGNSSLTVYILACAAPASLAFIMSFQLVESPAFLIHSLRPHQALASLSHMCERSFTPTCVNGLHPNSNDTLQDANLKAMSLLTPPAVVPLVVLSVAWFCMLFSSFGMTTWIALLFVDLNMQDPYFDALLFTAAIVPGNLFSIYFISHFGRRRMLFWGTVLSGLCILGLAADPTDGALVVLSACLYNMFLVVGWSGLSCLSVDAYFDVRVKSLAMGFLAAVGRLAGIIAQVNMVNT